jgi:hypothetical protein
MPSGRCHSGPDDGTLCEIAASWRQLHQIVDLFHQLCRSGMANHLSRKALSPHQVVVERLAPTFLVGVGGMLVV